MPTVGNNATLRFGTQADYDAATKDADAIYFVTDGTNRSIYVGSDKYSGYTPSASSIEGANRGLNVDGNNLVGHSATVTAVTTAALRTVKYDTYGHITGGAAATSSDIPSLPASKITSGTFADARIASASIWNGKQDALVFNTAYNASTNKAATMSDVTSAALTWQSI